MALNFPNSPSLDQIHEENGTKWIWNGYSWTRVVSAGAQGFQGSSGSQGPQGAQGFQGLTGSGAQGATGAQGSQGSQGDQGPQGLTGVTGAQGNAGAQGATGGTGAQGATGVTGAQGTAGSQGSSGAQGADGNFGGAAFDYTFDSSTVDSDPGQGKLRLNQTTVTAANYLYIHHDDDNFVDATSYLQTIDDSTSNIKGHFSIAEKGNTSYYGLFSIVGLHTEYTNYFAVPVSYLSGITTSFNNNLDVIITFARTGDKGDTGAQGASGGAGSTGAQGSTGPTGSQGSTGATGAQGSAGAQGASGAQGTAGAQGAIGAQGASFNRTEYNYTATAGQTTFAANYVDGTDIDVFLNGVRLSPSEYTATSGTNVVLSVGASSGSIVDILTFQSAGPQGVQGSTGAQGSAGNQGVTGAQGSQGPQGIQGATGNQGAAGTQGAVGAQGAQGTTGPQGAQGATGNQGAQGAQGTAGAQGATGSQGSIGAQGSTGAQGAQGTAGAQGAQGTAGAQGAQGASGTLGSTGAQGAQGTAGAQGAQGSQGTSGTVVIPTGTVMLFYQAAAPTGWTQVTTQNNKALRVVSGTGGGIGGSTAFTSVFTSRTPAGTVSVSNAAVTLTEAQIPSHSHIFQAATGNDRYNNPYSPFLSGAGPNQSNYGTTSTGGGESHTHANTATFSGTALDFAVQYIDVIICSKN